MSDRLLAEFREAIITADAAGLASYVRLRFPHDKNLSKADALAEFVCGARNVLPSDLFQDAQDSHFVRLMELVAAKRSSNPRILGSSIIEAGPQLDFLEHICLPKQLSSIQTFSLALQCRRIPEKRVAIVLMARDEGIYLPEWISHHRLIGAEHIFVYTNDNSDGSDELLRALALAGSITLINNRFAHGVNPQRKAYQHAIMLLDELRDYRWALFIDADEFLNLRTDETGALPTLIDNVERQFYGDLPGGVVFPWNWRFTDRAFSRNEISVLGYYPHASLHKSVKSLINLQSTLAMCEVHIPTLDENSFLIDGAMRRIDGSDVWQGVQRPYSGPVTEHFWSKSFVEFLIKKRRGDHLALEGGQFLREFSQFFAWTGIPTDSNYMPISSEWIRKVYDGASEILSDSAVAEAYGNIVERYRKLVEDASKDDIMHRTYADLLHAIAPIMA